MPFTGRGRRGALGPLRGAAWAALLAAGLKVILCCMKVGINKNDVFNVQILST